MGAGNALWDPSSCKKGQSSPCAQQEQLSISMAPARKTGPITEDVPSDSAAFKRVKYKADEQCFTFRIHRDADGSRVVIKTSVSSASGCKKTAARIARLCFEKMEAGASEEEVLSYQSGLYQRCQAGTAEEAAQAPEAAAASKNKGDLASADSDKLVEDKVSGRISEDAPTDSMAHKAVKFVSSKHAYCFEMTRDGKREFMQATVKAANSCAEDAARIARLCYLRLEAGDAKDAVVRYRNSLYCQCFPPESEEQAQGSTKEEDMQSEELGDNRPAQSMQEPRISEDAVAGSAAHDAVQYDEGQGSYSFSLSRDGGEKIHMVTSVQAANGCQEDAARITRLCYVMAEAGTSEGDIMLFRDALCKRCYPADQSDEDDADWSSSEPEEKDLESEPVILEDAPPESLAHKQVKYSTYHGIWIVEHKKDGERVRVQTTVCAAHGNQEDAGRIARLCYDKIEAGCTKEEVLQFRNSLYQQCAAKRQRGLGGDEDPERPTKLARHDLKPWSELEPSDIDALNCDEIYVYEKELCLGVRRTQEQRVARLQALTQRNTLLHHWLSKPGEDAEPTNEPLQVWLAQIQKDPSSLKGSDLKHFEQVTLIPDAENLSMPERRTRLMQLLWERKEAEAAAALAAAKASQVRSPFDAWRQPRDKSEMLVE